MLWIVHSWLSSLRFSLTFICQCLWIVHSWLHLQSRVSKVSSALDCPFLFAPSISCAQSWQCSGLSILDCSFNLVCPKLAVLWIVHSWLSSLRFSLTFICQCLWIVHSWLLLQSRVPKLTVLWVYHSWLSSLRFSLTFICQCLWIVHSWLLLQSRVPKVDSALDCPFLIAPSISCVQS